MPSMSPAKQQQREMQAYQQRDALMRAAGWPIERRTRLLGKAIRTVHKQLDANKTIMARVDGTDGDTIPIEVPDNQSRLRAAELVVSLEGVSMGKSNEGGSSGPISITINAPWFQAEPTITGSHEVIPCGPSDNTLIDNTLQ